MLSLVVARPGPVCDGLVALLGAMPDIRKIVQIPEVVDVWDFVRVIEPDIILIYATSLTQELASLILQID